MDPKIERYKRKGKVKKLIKASRNDDWVVRGEAISALGDMDDPDVVEAIIPALKDEHGYVRSIAVRVIQRLPDPRAVEPLIEAWKDYKFFEGFFGKALEDLKKELIEALGKMKDARTFETLLSALTNCDDYIGCRAAYYLGKLGDKRAVKSLVSALKSQYKYKRRDAVSALLEIGVADESVIESLLQVIENEDYEDARSEAAEALGKMGGENEADRVIQIFDKPLKEHFSRNVRDALFKTLALIGKPAVKSLLKVLNKNDVWYMRSAADILGEIGDKRAVEPLVHAMSHIGNPAAIALDKLGWKPEDVFMKVIYFLAKESLDEIEDMGESAVDPLCQVLNDNNSESEICCLAAKALRKVTNARALESFLPALKSYYNPIRFEAAEALGVRGFDQAVGPLIEAAYDKAEEVRSAAIDSLVKIGGAKVTEALIREFEKGNLQPDIRYGFARGLGMIGDKKVAASVIEFIFTSYAHEWLSKFSSFKNLFGDYTHIIDFARTYSTSSKRVGISSYIERYTYEINIDCVEELSKINTPVSSNILHLLVKMKDVHGLPGEEEDGYSRLKSVSFQPIRKLARDELKKRGNPPYDSSAYLSEDGWTIKK